MPPHLNEFTGACSDRGRYKLELLTEGYPKARDLRNVMKMLEITAVWLEEDEKREAETPTDTGSVTVSALRIKPLKTRPDLLKALEDSKATWAQMTDDEKEAMLREQQKSWARQDMD